MLEKVNEIMRVIDRSRDKELELDCKLWMRVGGGGSNV